MSVLGIDDRVGCGYVWASGVYSPQRSQSMGAQRSGGVRLLGHVIVSSRKRSKGVNSMRAACRNGAREIVASAVAAFAQIEYLRRQLRRSGRRQHSGEAIGMFMIYFVWELGHTGHRDQTLTFPYLPRRRMTLSSLTWNGPSLCCDKMQCYYSSTVLGSRRSRIEGRSA